MAVNSTSNLVIAGPAGLYQAAVGTAEPALTNATINTAPSGWNDVGGTTGGVTLSIAPQYTMLEVDQVVDTPGAKLTSRDITVKTNLAENTVANFVLATGMAGTTVASTGSTGQSFTPVNDYSAYNPNYTALLFDAQGDLGFRRRIIVRKALSTDSVDVAYTIDGQTVYPVTWTAFYVSATVAPFVIQNASA